MAAQFTQLRHSFADSTSPISVNGITPVEPEPQPAPAPEPEPETQLEAALTNDWEHTSAYQPEPEPEPARPEAETQLAAVWDDSHNQQVGLQAIGQWEAATLIQARWRGASARQSFYHDSIAAAELLSVLLSEMKKSNGQEEAAVSDHQHDDIARPTTEIATGDAPGSQAADDGSSAPEAQVEALEELALVLIGDGTASSAGEVDVALLHPAAEPAVPHHGDAHGTFEEDDTGLPHGSSTESDGHEESSDDFESDGDDADFEYGDHTALLPTRSWHGGGSVASSFASRASHHSSIGSSQLGLSAYDLDDAQLDEECRALGVPREQLEATVSALREDGTDVLQLAANLNQASPTAAGSTIRDLLRQTSNG